MAACPLPSSTPALCSEVVLAWSESAADGVRACCSLAFTFGECISAAWSPLCTRRCVACAAGDCDALRSRAVVVVLVVLVVLLCSRPGRPRLALSLCAL